MWILLIKKTSVNTLHIGLYSVYLNVPIKHVQEKKKKKKFNCKRKGTFFYFNFDQLLFNCNVENSVNFSSIATLKKQR